MPTRIHWEGSFFANHSLALVNREIVGRLAPRAELRLSLASGEERTHFGWDAERVAQLRALERSAPGGADVVVRHRWPLDPAPPSAGKWVIFQPWEFGSLPRPWLEPMSFGADEVWVYSSFNRACYAESGIPEEKIRVIPLGVHEAMTSAPSAFPLRTRKRFKFLFVGGTILRKGIDLLLEAYTREFSREDDVCLVVKDFGTGSFYRGQTYGGIIRELQSKPGAPEVEYLDAELTSGQLRDLYHACDCLVHPFRGEGFGLPIAEAMACGLPVIVPDQGGASDFCTPETALLLPSRRVRIPEGLTTGMECVTAPWWLEVPVDSIRRRMREVYERPEGAREVAERGRRKVRESFTWDAAAESAAAGLAELGAADGPPLRRRPAAVEPARAAHPARWRSRKGPAILGVVMIVKNEAENLPHLFRSIADVADEVVVVDTGSTDATVRVCEEWGVRVVHEAWRDDFAFARNRSIGAATAKHLLWLDGDDRVPPATRKRLCWLRDTVLPKTGKQAFVLEVQNLNAAGEVLDTFVQARVFPRHPRVRFRHAIHEEVVSSLNENGVEIVRLDDAAIHHLGYGDAAANAGKVRRNEALLRAALEKDPDDFHARLHMAQTLYTLGRLPEAEAEMTEVIARSGSARVKSSFVAELHALRSTYRQRLGNRPAALEDMERASELWPEWGIPCAALAELHLARGDEAAAWAAVERSRTASFEATIFGFPVRQARRNLELVAARILRGRGDEAGRIACLARVLDLFPGELKLRLELGQALLDAGRFEEALAVLEPAGRDEANASALVEISAAIALARMATGDEAGAAACLSPLLHVFAEQLGGADDVGPLELAEAMLHAGYGVAAKNVMALFQHTVLAAR